MDRDRLRLLLAGFASAVIMTIVALMPATGAAAPPCGAGQYCVYTNGNFGGPGWSHPGSDSYENVAAFIQDQGSSWINHTGRRICIYDNAGAIVLDTLSNGTHRGTVPAGTNDRIDSVGWC